MLWRWSKHGGPWGAASGCWQVGKMLKLWAQVTEGVEVGDT